jgi:hypothetical protein
MATSPMIRLGIVVVYFVPEGNERLLDLHLRQIEKHTQEPYTIFGCATRVSANARTVLTTNSHVRLCDCPPAPAGARPTSEHAHYLEHLTRAAIDAGVTHVVTLHVDSFPVEPGWVQALANRLSDKCAIVAPDVSYTAGIMFTREFYLRFAPSFLVTDTERGSSDYERFLATCKPAQHSGTGYLFRAYLAGYSADLMQARVAPFASARTGELYDGVLFHFGHAAYLARAASGRLPPPTHARVWAQAVVSLARYLLPAEARPVARRRLRWLIGESLEAASHDLGQRQIHRELAELVADPDRYINRLRK